MQLVCMDSTCPNCTTQVQQILNSLSVTAPYNCLSSDTKKISFKIAVLFFSNIKKNLGCRFQSLYTNSYVSLVNYDPGFQNMYTDLVEYVYNKSYRAFKPIGH